MLEVRGQTAQVLASLIFGFQDVARKEELVWYIFVVQGPNSNSRRRFAGAHKQQECAVNLLDFGARHDLVASSGRSSSKF